MTPPKAYAAYRETAINTIQDKQQIVLMLFDGAVRFVRDSRVFLFENRMLAKGLKIVRVIDILKELNSALDHEVGGEIAQNLEALYQYMIQRLSWANMHNDVEALDEVEHLLCTLREGFEGAYEQLKQQGCAAFGMVAPVKTATFEVRCAV